MFVSHTASCALHAAAPEEDKDKDRVKLKLLSEGGEQCSAMDVVKCTLNSSY